MISKYKTVSDAIENDIQTGVYNDVDKLPTEDDLISTFQVSRNTIRKAIEILVKKGLVFSIQGSGLFVRRSSCEGCVNLENFHGLTAIFKDNVSSKIIDFQQIPANEWVASKLNCTVGTPIYYIERVRYLNKKPYVYEYSYYNKEIIPYLSKELIAGSIYHYIQEDLKLQIGYVDRIIFADKLTSKQAIALELNEGDPALVTHNLAMLKSGVVFDYSIDIHHYKETKFLKLANFF